MLFSDETFDFVICYGGGIKALKELARVTKKKGKISMCVENIYGNVISKFYEKPEQVLALLTSKSDYGYHEDEEYGFVSEREAKRFFEKKGIKIIDIYACEIWNSLAIPKEVLESRGWDRNFFRQTTEIMLKLAKEPSIRSVSKRWVVYGKKV